MKKEVLRFDRVTYKEKGVTLLGDFSLDLNRGEIMGLMPLETVGLDAFVHLLQVNEPLFYGYVYYRENCVNSWRIRHRTENKIALISGVSSLVDGQDVLTNLFILQKGYRQHMVRKGILRRQIGPLMEEIRFQIDPGSLVESLSPLERVVVEILRAVVAGCQLIVLREIGTVVSEDEMGTVYRILHHFTDKGWSFLFISMHFEEIRQICGRVAIMEKSMISMILDRVQMKRGVPRLHYQSYFDEVAGRRRWPGAGGRGGEICLSLETLDIRVRPGECLVIQSLNTRIHEELERAASDLAGGKNGVSFLPENPEDSMLFGDMSPLDNLCMMMDRRMPGTVAYSRVQRLIREEFVRVTGEDIFDRGLKVLTQMEKNTLLYMGIYFLRPSVVFLSQPYKSADVENRRRIWQLQERLLQRGITIVILAVNMADALSIADRVVRIDGQGGIREYRREEFAEALENSPWAAVCGREECHETEEGGDSRH